jgi:hypothetical protein
VNGGGLTGMMRRRGPWQDRGALRRLAMLVIAMPVVVAHASEPRLSDFAFWRANEGWWRSENTYFDRNLDYNIRSYNSVVHVELDGATYRETEYKFYPPGKMAQGLGAGRTGADEGVETVTLIVGQLQDASGTVRLKQSVPAYAGNEVTEIRVLGADNGMRVTTDPATGFDSYRMLVTLPSPDRRYIANFGLVSSNAGPGAANAAPGAAMGDLRGFSLFRSSRVSGDEFDRLRHEFRERNKVAAIVEPGANGTPVVRRLDDR